MAKMSLGVVMSGCETEAKCSAVSDPMTWWKISMRECALSGMDPLRVLAYSELGAWLTA